MLNTIDIVVTLTIIHYYSLTSDWLIPFPLLPVVMMMTDAVIRWWWWPLLVQYFLLFCVIHSIFQWWHCLRDLLTVVDTVTDWPHYYVDWWCSLVLGMRADTIVQYCCIIEIYTSCIFGDDDDVTVFDIDDWWKPFCSSVDGIDVAGINEMVLSMKWEMSMASMCLSA
jgi:hypothetical protein